MLCCILPQKLLAKCWIHQFRSKHSFPFSEVKHLLVPKERLKHFSLSLEWITSQFSHESEPRNPRPSQTSKIKPLVLQPQNTSKLLPPTMFSAVWFRFAHPELHTILNSYSENEAGVKKSDYITLLLHIIMKTNNPKPLAHISWKTSCAHWQNNQT